MQLTGTGGLSQRLPICYPSAMAYDFKSEYKEYYQAGKIPKIIFIPSFRYLCTEGSGKASRDNAAFQEALSGIGRLSQTLRSCERNGHHAAGSFEYVLPPAEVLQSLERPYSWRINMRIPDFFSQEDLDWAAEFCRSWNAAVTAGVKLSSYSYEMCVQTMHTGTNSTKSAAYARLEEYIAPFGYRIDHARSSCEILLSDPARCPRNRMRTIIRLPIC